MNTIIENKINMGWNFDNSYVFMPDRLFTKQDPVPVSSPKLIILNQPLAKSLGLNIETLQGEDAVDIFAGNKIPEKAFPIAQAYAGHQFGHFTMLGDGRAVLLGEQITPKGSRFDIQLKGSGRTPYSRGGDGRAVLGPMLREYIISEAMEGLRIPTTRSLAVVTTGENIRRERILPGAILTRIAASHIRIGTFQYISNYGSIGELQLLADYTLQRHFPDIASDENRYFSLLKEVIKLQAELIAKWQLVGFIHGVMNTDNMAISGETIDYGPCAFMDTYDPNTVFSSIDRSGRYAYANQPKIAAWNLSRFAETLLPMLHEDQEVAIKIINEEISDFEKIYFQKWINGMRLKLGLFNEEPEDQSIIVELLDIMEKNKADYTNTFRGLTINNLTEMDLFRTPEFAKWNENWEARLGKQSESMDESYEVMRENNPAIIPRNHRVEEALDAAERDDYSLMLKLINVLSNPYAYSSEQDEFANLPSTITRPYRTFCGT